LRKTRKEAIAKNKAIALEKGKAYEKEY